MMKPTRWLVLASRMPEPSKTRHFLDAYRGAFETFDVEAIADLFSYPCQITSDAGEVTVTTVGAREAWVPQVERLLSAYSSGLNSPCWPDHRCSRPFAAESGGALLGAARSACLGGPN
jgi:hypothetical protein